MTSPLTIPVETRTPTVLEKPNTYVLRCNRPSGCPRPRCGKALLTVHCPTPPQRDLVMVRECPRSKSLLCEFPFAASLPTEVRR